MEVFLLILPIMIGVSVSTALYRFNARFFQLQIEKTATLLNDNTLHLMNAAGKWLTAAGVIATLPLVLVLLFAPETSSSDAPWVTPTGMLGLGTLVIAAIVLAITFIGEWLTHPSGVKHIIHHYYQFTIKRWFGLYGLKALGWFVGTVVVAFLMPFIADLLIAIGYVAFFFVAGRLGMLDNLEEEGDEEIDYVKQGVDYDFYNGTNIYDSFPD